MSCLTSRSCSTSRNLKRPWSQLFTAPGPKTEAPVSTGRTVLCLDSNADVLAYLRELLRRAGYDVHTSSHRGDALMLMRVTRFDLLLAGLI